MKRNCEFIDLGEFEMTSPVMRVSDPCYERDVWCCGTVDHCKLGTWEAGVLKTDEGEWGTRCAVLAVRHKDTGPDFNVIRLGKVRKVACKCVEQSFEVGVDSGQAGFFDDAFYQNDTVFEELPAPGFAMVADYVKENGNHVMYRVTPIFEGDNLLANGVLMEGYSVEDKGAGVSYCVFAYNVQPGIEIDYATGESKLADGAQQEEQKTATVTPTPSPEPEKQEPATGSEASQADYILNTNTKKFHYPTCSSVNDMKEKNKQEFFGTRDEAISNGYSPCGRCKP